MAKNLNNYLILTTALCQIGILLIAAPAAANPLDGQITDGSAIIQQTGNKTDIYQSSNRAIINWKSFNIEAGEHTEFHQPSSSSITLNRVNSSDPSHILGKLTANGHIVLVNPNGVIFGKNSIVDVNGIVATTADIRDEDFMAGKMHFSQPGKADAAIINYGNINAHDAGLVGFVAPHVLNDGTITAKIGRVHLASGDAMTVDFYGDGLMEVQVSDAVKSQLVANNGNIVADGGTIGLTAAAGSHIVNSLISSGGTLRARSLGDKKGTIILYAEGNNAVKDNVAALKGQKSGESRVSTHGIIDVSGYGTGEQGGNINILGDNIHLDAGTRLDASGHSAASGKAAGGNIKVGGDYTGKGFTPTAKKLYVDAQATIHNDATTSGDGGRTIFWSDGRTDFHGKVFSRGGSLRGNGGFLETSGKQILSATGYADLTAKNGWKGMYLIDPMDIFIYDNSYPAPDGSSTFTAAYIQNLSLSSDVTLLADNSITLDLQGTSINLTPHSSLTLQTVNGNILTASSGGINGTEGTIIFNAGGNGNILFNHAFTVNGPTGFEVLTSGGGLGNIEVNAPLNWNTLYTQLFSENHLLINSAITETSGSTDRYLQFRASSYDINADLNGHGYLYFIDRNSLGFTFGIGDGVVADNIISNSDLNHIIDGWNIINFDSDGAHLNIAAHTWQDDVLFRSGLGILRIQGTQNMGNNDLTIGGRNDILITAPLIGTGTLTFRPFGSSANVFYIGDAAIAADPAATIFPMKLYDSSLAQVQDGWQSITFTGDFESPIYFGSNTPILFSDPVHFSTQNASINILGDIGFTVGSNGGLVFEDTFATVNQVNIAGTIDATNAPAGVLFQDIDQLNLAGNIIGGNHNIFIANTVTSTAITGNSTLNAGNGNITINSPVNLSNHTFTLRSNALDLNGNITGNGSLNIYTDNWTGTGNLASASGSFTFAPYTVSHTLALGNGGVGLANFVLSDARLADIQAGFNNYTFGSASSGSVRNFYSAWNGSVNFMTAGDFTNEAAIIATGTVSAIAGDDITLLNDITANGAGNAIVLSAEGNFYNFAGANALAVNNPAARWLVYTLSPVTMQRDGLLPANSDFGKTYAINAPATIGIGNRFVYATSTRPVLNYQVNNITITEGDIFTGSNIQYIGGLLPGDNTNTIGLTGAPNFITGYVQGDPAGTYAINGAAGSMISSLGYDFSFTPGTLTVNSVPSNPVPNNNLPSSVYYPVQLPKILNRSQISSLMEANDFQKLLFIDPKLKFTLGIEDLDDANLL